MKQAFTKYNDHEVVLELGYTMLLETGWVTV